MAPCDHCKSKKIGLLPFSCRCDYKNLCMKCRLPESHLCSFDYKKYIQKKLTDENPVIMSKKIDII